MMDAQNIERLTLDDARKLDLSINPFVRNRQVREVLSNTALIGAEVWTDAPSLVAVVQSDIDRGGPVIVLSQISPLLGRRHLTKAVKTVEYYERNK